MFTINIISAVVSFVFVGVVLGLFGNYFEHYSLIIFPLFGFGISVRIRKVNYELWKRLTFSISVSIGIFISVFLPSEFLIEWPFWLKVAYVLGGASLFFLGYNGREIYYWNQDRKWASKMG